MNPAHPFQTTPVPTTTPLAYHHRTRHHPHHYAASLGYLDWATQPDPFRRFPGALTLPLDLSPVTPLPRYDDLFVRRPEAAPFDARSLAQLFFDSFALSAWKVLGDSRWSLRVNPSSGNLHPTEAYLIAGPVPGLADHAAVWHYAPHAHALERRRTLHPSDWTAFQAGAGHACCIALTSIHWREAWKYGERAFRYCQHDVGHAIAAVALAAAALGWHAFLVETLADIDLARLLGLDDQAGPESEHPDCLLAIQTSGAAHALDPGWPAPEAIDRIAAQPLHGTPNRLSPAHHPWPIIDEIAGACRKPRIPPPARPVAFPNSNQPARPLSARQLIRQRRSAVAMDGHTPLARADFFRLLERLLPTPEHPFLTAWPWPPHVDLALFVHRVTGLPRGLYWLDRQPAGQPTPPADLRPDFAWKRLPESPAHLPLFQLLEGSCEAAARFLCCHQEIAADGAFAVAMIARFTPVIERHGPWFYRRLFWESGILGQILYLEAEAAGLRGTGIGCFFDDPTHDLLGIRDPSRQSLYHFTIGGPVEDPRLQTLDPYSHRT